MPRPGCARLKLSNTMNAKEALIRWRYRLIPDHLIGELLGKSWMDNAIPFLILLITLGLLTNLIPGFLSGGSVATLSQDLGEYLFVVLGMVLVLKAGGIDLSVGSVYALCNFVALGLVNKFELPLVVAIPLVLATGGLVGLVNGVLIGYLRLRAFLTTLASLIIVRALVDILSVKYGFDVSAVSDKPVMGWELLGEGSFLGLPSVVLAAVVAAALMHIVMSRMRFGWHISAVGGSRRSAYNAGLPVRRVVCMTYVLSGAFAGAAALFHAARMSSAGSSVGEGLEMIILTAAVLGGNSLGGGRGSAMKGVLGAITVVMITNGLVRLGLGNGAAPMVLGATLLAAVAIDVRWLKNRGRVLATAYVAPTYDAPPVVRSTEVGSGSPYEKNNSYLTGAKSIGEGIVEGPEDMILDDDDNLYCGDRRGDIYRFFAPDYTRWEVYAHTGGHPLGMAWNPEGELVSCISGMGLYKVTKSREVVKLSDQTNRSLFSIIDDSRIRLADDLDIAPDGRVFFSEATIRYDAHEWMFDALEARPNGRLLCYDPRDNSTRTIVRKSNFANGICMVGDGESFLYALTWRGAVRRYWFDGPNKGRDESVIDDCPGFTDNINRASDGNFWCGLVGMRSHAFDLALKMPKFRKHMVHRVAQDEWICPNLNAGAVIKFDLQGNILATWWDIPQESHPAVTSVREHRGNLYLGSIFHGRVGCVPIPGADPNWTGMTSYWGGRK